MIKLLTTALLIAIGTAQTVAAQAATDQSETAATTPRAIAEAWLDAYSRQDFDRMTALMTADTVFLDPTSFEIAAVTERIEWRGPVAITAGIAAWGVDHATYTIDRTYEASRHVVFIGHVDVAYGTGAAAQTYRYPITTIVRVADGHVLEHRDYTDFAGAARVMEDQ